MTMIEMIETVVVSTRWPVSTAARPEIRLLQSMLRARSSSSTLMPTLPRSCSSSCAEAGRFACTSVISATRAGTIRLRSPMTTPMIASKSKVRWRCRRSKIAGWFGDDGDRITCRAVLVVVPRIDLESVTGSRAEMTNAGRHRRRTPLHPVHMPGERHIVDRKRIAAAVERQIVRRLCPGQLNL